MGSRGEIRSGRRNVSPRILTTSVASKPSHNKNTCNMYIYLSWNFEKLETVSNFRAGTCFRILFSSLQQLLFVRHCFCGNFHLYICTAKIKVFISRSHQSDQTQDHNVNQYSVHKQGSMSRTPLHRPAMPRCLDRVEI